MAIKALQADLWNLRKKYKSKEEYFLTRYENSHDVLVSKRLYAQYEFSKKACQELDVLIATHERIFK